MMLIRRYDDAPHHWRVTIPLSRRRVVAWSVNNDTLMPLRKYWALTWMRCNFGSCTEIRVRFGVVYE